MKSVWKTAVKVLCIIGLLAAILSPSIFAQVGSGPAPPAVAVPDKFPTLNWSASMSSGVTYNVYRGIVAGGTKGRINVAPVTLTTYRDTAASFGAQNFYTVTAQRTSDGVESEQSNEVSAAAVQGSPAKPAQLNAVLAFFVKVGKTVYAGLRAFVGIFS